MQASFANRALNHFCAVLLWFRVDAPFTSDLKRREGLLHMRLDGFLAGFYFGISRFLVPVARDHGFAPTVYFLTNSFLTVAHIGAATIGIQRLILLARHPQKKPRLRSVECQAIIDTSFACRIIFAQQAGEVNTGSVSHGVTSLIAIFTFAPSPYSIISMRGCDSLSGALIVWASCC